MKTLRVAQTALSISRVLMFGVIAASAALLAKNVVGVANAVVGKPLSKDQVQVLTKAALNGDGHAAMQLTNHYMISEDQSEGKYWYRIAIENQDSEAMQAYAAKLWMSGGARNCTRALHLYDKLLGGGAQKADTDFLKEARAQRGQMVTDLPNCEKRTCSKFIDGAWCD